MLEINRLYRIKYNPVNRKQKRIAQKETEKIQKECLPVIFAYYEAKDKNDNLTLFARDEFIKRCKVANKGNIFIEANTYFFEECFKTEKKKKESIKPKKSQKYSAIVIMLVILILILLSLFWK